MKLSNGHFANRYEITQATFWASRYWTKQNLKRSYFYDDLVLGPTGKYRAYYVIFDSDEDAMLFKMKFG
jgi:hypothetical protein